MSPAENPREPESTAHDPGHGAPVQGEGDYEAARRHRDAATRYVRDHDVERAARDAAPRSPEEARALRDAEAAGRSESRGEDRRDVMQESAIDSPSDDKAT